MAGSLLLCHFVNARITVADGSGTALLTGRCLTYQSRQLPAPEAHADAHVEAVGVREALVALRHCDVDGDGQEDGHVHRDDGPGPGTGGGEGLHVKTKTKNKQTDHKPADRLASAAPRCPP